VLELAAVAIVVMYLGLGAAARLLVTVRGDPADVTNDEMISLILWFFATAVAGIAMIVLGSGPIDVLSSAVIVIVLGGVGYALLHYGVWGAHLMSMGADGSVLDWVSGFIVIALGPVILPIALLTLATRAVERIDGGAILTVISAVIIAIGAFGAVVRGGRRRADWLRAADAAAVRDPEFADELRAAGWRADGPFDEMVAIWDRTRAKVNRPRRDADLPIFEGPNWQP
jgi:hypothetical protein